MKSIVYCLLLETDEGLLLIDCGFGVQDYTNPSRLMHWFQLLMGVPGNLEETALSQVEQLGFGAEDVKHIIFTHLHIDHAGGMRDFPGANVHVSEREMEVAMRPRGIVERGYDRRHWLHEPKWRPYEKMRGNWFGFPAIQILEEIGEEIWLVWLPGHTSGHCGVAMATDDGWLMHCGDAASPYHRAVDIERRPSDQQPLNFLPASVARQMIGCHGPALRELKHRLGGEITLISSHDIYSFQKLTGGNLARSGQDMASTNPDRSRL